MSSNPTTVISAQTQLKGNIEGEEDISVAGRIEGTISLSQSLIVQSSGVIVADVRASRVEIFGVVQGNITASEVIKIDQGGRVMGDLKAPRVILAEGAAFRGSIDMGDLDAPRKPPTKESAEKTVQKQPSIKSAQTPPPSVKAPAIKQRALATLSSRKIKASRPTAKAGKTKPSRRK